MNHASLFNALTLGMRAAQAMHADVDKELSGIDITSENFADCALFGNSSHWNDLLYFYKIKISCIILSISVFFNT